MDGQFGGPANQLLGILHEVLWDWMHDISTSHHAFGGAQEEPRPWNAYYVVLTAVAAISCVCVFAVTFSRRNTTQVSGSKFSLNERRREQVKKKVRVQG